MSTEMLRNRPAPPSYSPPSGWEWQVIEDDYRSWRLATADESAARKCRRSTRLPCPNAPVAAMRRGLSSADWFYCAEHMYGRWIEDGRVVMWAARKVAAA